jgi:hypothetical protein
MLRLPEERKPEYRSARAELGEQFARVLSRVPARLAEDVAAMTTALAPNPAELTCIPAEASALGSTIPIVTITYPELASSSGITIPATKVGMFTD